MPGFKMYFLIMAAVSLTACDSSSSKQTSGENDTGGGEGEASGVSALFSASPDSEALALDLDALPDALSSAFGDADDEPKTVDTGADLTALLP